MKNSMNQQLSQNYSIFEVDQQIKVPNECQYQTQESSLDKSEAMESFFRATNFIEQQSILENFYRENAEEQLSSLLYASNYFNSSSKDYHIENYGKIKQFKKSSLKDAMIQINNKKYLYKLEKDLLNPVQESQERENLKAPKSIKESITHVKEIKMKSQIVQAKNSEKNQSNSTSLGELGIANILKQQRKMQGDRISSIQDLKDKIKNHFDQLSEARASDEQLIKHKCRHNKQILSLSIFDNQIKQSIDDINSLTNQKAYQTDRNEEQDIITKREMNNFQENSFTPNILSQYNYFQKKEEYPQQQQESFKQFSYSNLKQVNIIQKPYSFQFTPSKVFKQRANSSVTTIRKDKNKIEPSQQSQLDEYIKQEMTLKSFSKEINSNNVQDQSQEYGHKKNNSYNSSIMFFNTAQVSRESRHQNSKFNAMLKCQQQEEIKQRQLILQKDTIQQRKFSGYSRKNKSFVKIFKNYQELSLTNDGFNSANRDLFVSSQKLKFIPQQQQLSIQFTRSNQKGIQNTFELTEYAPDTKSNITSFNYSNFKSVF